MAEFWEKRVDASGVRPTQTRIPENPDQTVFLEKWYEFHRGYRIVRRGDGGEERVAVLGEPFAQVDPGCLPRTLEEMRAGRAAVEAVAAEQDVPISTQEATGPSLDDTLEQMFADAEAEDESTPRRATQRPAPEQQDHWSRLMAEANGGINGNVHAQAIVAAGSRNREYQARRVTALRRELQRMRSGIERVMTGLRDLGEAVPESDSATARLTNLGTRIDALNGRPSSENAEVASTVIATVPNNSHASNTEQAMANMQTRLDEARQQMYDARRNRDQAASEMDAAEQEFRTSQQRHQQLQREQRTTENYMRLFGTREEMQAQGEQYESPIGGMFNRAYERFRAAEDVRREERTLRRVLEEEAQAGDWEHAARLAELTIQPRDVWGVPQQGMDAEQIDTTTEEALSEPGGELEEYYALLRRQNWSQRPVEDSQPQQPLSAPTAAADQPDAVSSESRRLEDFPRSMLRGYRPERPQVVRVGGLVHGLDAGVPEAEDWREEAKYVISHLIAAGYSSEDVNTPFGTDIYLRDIFVALESNESVGLEIEEYCKDLIRKPEYVWKTGLMAQRLSRQRTRHIESTQYPSVTISNGKTYADDPLGYMEVIEMMAEAFQMSSEVRRRATSLTAPERLSMLYRLQAGTRQDQDVMRLQDMYQDEDAYRVAERVHRTAHLGLSTPTNERQSELDQQRRDAARFGDHSRQELDASRQATSALALAAGRTAMQTGPDALLERMRAADTETQAAYERLLRNGYVPPDGASSSARLLRSTMYHPLHVTAVRDPSDTDSEADDGEQGLDARDTGRPEPLADESLQVSMECRICYTQLAEIACLPCGHLVMCKWCSEQHSPVLQHDRTRPRRAAGCPVCRKGIRQKVRVFRA
ncbi:hypothetical protein LTR62_007835 [Meristemomyces frigidus]|uniref:RING-type domain-containing protein n=1 Tax=Meristemomyces frigidus TaxID=1508187 RepID=A0AAN7TBC1_9PEZI|nr:hypothetical protein LTR62_007835 [Meristemomyces frigidus]